MVPDYANILDSEDYSFMIKENLWFDKILDARGLTKKEYKSLARDLDLNYVFVGRSCHVGHYLKLRSGHCPICQPASSGFSKRYNSSGYVYIAYSKKKRLVKVGYCSSLINRQNSLNKEAYAGAVDWRVEKYIWSEKAGKLESDIHMKLHAHQANAICYFKGTYLLKAREVYTAPLSYVIDIFDCLVG